MKISSTNRRAFTIMELMVVMILTSITLVILHQIFYGLMYRGIAVQRRAEGQQSVRLLLTRMRSELRKAITTVQIDKQNQLITIPLEDPLRKLEDRERHYFSEYEFVPERTDVVVRRRDRDKKIIEEGYWLGGSNQIVKFKCYDTGENERILFQYYRVILEVDHYEVRMSDVVNRKPTDDEKSKKAVHLTTTVYPRRVNMELRIEVPQEGGSGI